MSVTGSWDNLLNASLHACLQGAGTCPFGTSCFYRHVHADGREESRDASALRRYVDQEGDMRIVSGVMLSDFLALGTRGRRVLDGATVASGSRGGRRGR